MGARPHTPKKRLCVNAARNAKHFARRGGCPQPIFSLAERTHREAMYKCALREGQGGGKATLLQAYLGPGGYPNSKLAYVCTLLFFCSEGRTIYHSVSVVYKCALVGINLRRLAPFWCGSRCVSFEKHITGRYTKNARRA